MGGRHRDGLDHPVVQGALGYHAAVPKFTGDIGGEPAQDTEAQRRVDDPRRHVVSGIRWRRGVAVLEVAQVGPHPLRRHGWDRAALRGHGDRPVRARLGGAAHGQRTGRTPPIPSGHHQRHPGQQVGQPSRAHGVLDSREPRGTYFQPGRQRRPGAALDDAGQGLVEAVLVVHQHAASPTDTGQAAQESGVDGLIDTDRVQPYPPQIAGQLLQ